MSRSNGRPEPEVIMNFSDGYSYSKGKLDSACFVILENGPVKVAKDSKPVPKKEDIDLIVNEFEISRARAERALSDNDRDVVKTMYALINLHQ
ncbi:hypothetical protein F5876DRAFT_47027 [Lentinula aff. lateritia]|uniref:Uncharacterized protein n=1 Tax=Lentinula aff. lateritia TaxID=2804960 RepID=A0ACC1TT89_9AGAR|nr:hypothetical protein F5876DRAFT_47027 [Lentinula aff. lateritia]